MRSLIEGEAQASTSVDGEARFSGRKYLPLKEKCYPPPIEVGGDIFSTVIITFSAACLCALVQLNNGVKPAEGQSNSVHGLFF